MVQYSPGFIDTHCHLDFLFQRINHTGRLSHYKTKSAATDPFPVSFEGCVAIFCKPWTFKQVNVVALVVHNAENGGKLVWYIQGSVEGTWLCVWLYTFPVFTGVLVEEFIARRWGMGRLWLSPTFCPKLRTRGGNSPTPCPSQSKDYSPWGNWT